MFKRFLFVLLCIVSIFSLSAIVFGKDDVAERLDTVVNFDGQKIEFTSYDINGSKYMKVYRFSIFTKWKHHSSLMLILHHRIKKI